GREIGVAGAIIPAQAPVFSAYGIALSDIVRQYSLSQPLPLPVQPSRLETIFGQLDSMAKADNSAPKAVFQRAVDMRFRSQAHVVRIALGEDPIYNEELVEDLVQRFLVAYEDIYGAGTAYRDAGIELVTFRLSVITPIARPGIQVRDPALSRQARLLETRQVRFNRQ